MVSNLWAVPGLQSFQSVPDAYLAPCAEVPMNAHVDLTALCRVERVQVLLPIERLVGLG
jgi:hypothetical protein